MGDQKETRDRKLAPFLHLLVVEKEHHNELMKLVNAICEAEVKGDGIEHDKTYDAFVDWIRVRDLDRQVAMEKIYDLLYTLSTPLNGQSYGRQDYVKVQLIRRRREGKLPNGF